MPEQIATPTQQEQPQAAQPSFSEKMQQSFFGEAPVNNGAQQPNAAQPQNNGQQPQPPAQPQEPIKPKDEFENVDPEVWLKTEFKDYGFESVAKAKEMISDWKKAKDNPVKEEIKFDNDYTKNVYQYLKEGKWKDLNKHLSQQEQLEVWSSAEVTNENAEAVIKLGMKMKNNNLSDKEIEFQYKEEYLPGKEPVQRGSETDEDFAERKGEYDERVEKLNMKRSIAAKMAQPDLQKLKSELVLPDILPKAQQQSQPSPEDVEKDKVYLQTFLASADKSLNSFNGFSVTVKDKDVELPISYGLSAEEKNVINDKVKKFVESGYDVNSIFVDDWVNADKTINTDKMTEDLARLYFGNKAAQKFAEEGANQRLEAYIKGKKQINLNEQQPQGTFQPPAKSKSEQLQEKFWN